ncbi:MAG: DUF418 domain-containing protein [Pseudomonadota bacterium]|nr:DUF418 domain-containing protein [Pseudomonadota bacterium]
MDDREGRGLHVLLGVTLFGLLLANLPGQAGVWPAADLPLIGGRTLSFADTLVWWTGQTLVSWTFNLLLIAGFGAWLAWRQDRLVPTALGWMLLGGLATAYLVWFGELVSIMALAAMVAVPMRALRPVTRLVTAALLIAGTLLIVVAGAGITALLPASMDAGQLLGFDAERIAAAEAAHRSGFFARLPGNMATALQFHLIELVFLGGGVLGLILLGMAALESGFIGGRWPAMRYVLIAAVCLGIGLPMTGWAAAGALARDFDPSGFGERVSAHALGAVLNAAGIAALIAALIALVPGQGLPAALVRLFERTGRVWLSLYLAQILVAALLFYTLPGLALFGRLPPAGLAALALVLCAAQAGSVWLWSQHFRTGPAEWLLDGLAQRRFGPLRR